MCNGESTIFWVEVVGGNESSSMLCSPPSMRLVKGQTWFNWKDKQERKKDRNQTGWIRPIWMNEWMNEWIVCWRDLSKGRCAYTISNFVYLSPSCLLLENRLYMLPYSNTYWRLINCLPEFFCVQGGEGGVDEMA